MKKSGSKSANMYVMFGLLAVLFVSLGCLSMQSIEGMTMPAKKKAGFKGGREGLTTLDSLKNLPIVSPPAPSKQNPSCMIGQRWNEETKKCTS